jgi:hypothetical protein
MIRAGTRVLLGLSSLVLLFIGGSILLDPHAFYATNHVVLTQDPSQLSEVRAPAGLLLVSGAWIGAGAFVQAQRRTALQIAAIVYGSYGLSRALGVLVDGWPSEGLVAAMGIELVLGVLAGSLLLADAR